jgi:hypothetical protein
MEWKERHHSPYEERQKSSRILLESVKEIKKSSIAFIERKVFFLRVEIEKLPNACVREMQTKD